MGTRASVGWLLLRPTARTIRWSPLAIGVPLGFLFVWSGLRHGGDASVMQLPVAGGLLAAWVGFLLGDAAAETVSSAPTTILTRRVVRVALAVPVLVPAWAAFVAYGDGSEKVLTLSAALAAQLVVSLAFAAAGSRRGVGYGGPLAIAGLFLVFVVVPLLFKVPLTLNPETDSWYHLYGQWLWIGAAGLLVFCMASADPCRRGPIAWLQSTRPRPAVAAPEVVS
jgi:hypothetical protein